MNEFLEAREYFPTPPWAVQRLLERVPELTSCSFCIEPCVGDGSILRGFPLWSARRWFVNDIRLTNIYPGTQTVRWHNVQDAVEVLRSISEKPTLCITNPPFKAGQPIVEAGVECSRMAAFLLPIGYPRTHNPGWWRRHKPQGCLQLGDRPSFNGDGTAFDEYAWFTWGCGNGWDLLDETPVLVRKAAEADARALLAGLDLPVDPQQELFG